MIRWLVALAALSTAAPAVAGDVHVTVLNDTDFEMPIPGTVVTLHGPVDTTVCQADGDGLCEFTDLDAGLYRLDADKEGFTSVTVSDIRVVDGRTTPVTVKLPIGPVREVEVSAKRPAVAGSRGEVLTKEFLARVPTSRSYQAGVSMAQGVTGGGGNPNVGGGAFNEGPANDPAATETWLPPGINPTEAAALDALSTFSVDVDTASWTRVRRSLGDGFLPAPGMVRPEEFVNFLPFEYAPPATGPFAVHAEAATSPWAEDETLLRIGLQGERVSVFDRKTAHLTFLVDVSCSMTSADKLPLVRQGLSEMVWHLDDDDTVALVTYAGASRVVLPPTPVTDRQRILDAIAELHSSGGTAMAQGIHTAYALAEQVATPETIDRVIIASDGDANIGVTNAHALVDLIRGHAKRGITLTTLGFGTGNYRDHRMERLANDGDGNYFYIDGMKESRRVLVKRMTGTLQVIARDVKIQVAFDPDVVATYRLIGYENRDLADADFDDDAVDAGEVGNDHQVTAIYALSLTGAAGRVGELWLRYKPPGPDAPSAVRSFVLPRVRDVGPLAHASADLRLAAASVGFAEILRGNAAPYLTLPALRDLAAGAASPEYPEHAELVWAIDRAMELSP